MRLGGRGSTYWGSQRRRGVRVRRAVSLHRSVGAGCAVRGVFPVCADFCLADGRGVGLSWGSKAVGWRMAARARRCLCRGRGGCAGFGSRRDECAGGYRVDVFLVFVGFLPRPRAYANAHRRAVRSLIRCDPSQRTAKRDIVRPRHLSAQKCTNALRAQAASSRAQRVYRGCVPGSSDDRDGPVWPSPRAVGPDGEERAAGGTRAAVCVCASVRHRRASATRGAADGRGTLRTRASVREAVALAPETETEIGSYAGADPTASARTQVQDTVPFYAARASLEDARINLRPPWSGLSGCHRGALSRWLLTNPCINARLGRCGNTYWGLLRRRGILVRRVVSLHLSFGAGCAVRGIFLVCADFFNRPRSSRA